MFDRDVALEAFSAVLNANVTSVQKQSTGGFAGGRVQQRNTVLRPTVMSSHKVHGARDAFPSRLLLTIKLLMPTLLHADENSQVSRSNIHNVRRFVADCPQASDLLGAIPDIPTGKNHIINEDEFFAPQFDYDFTKLRDSETYYRGGEVYERPGGWYRLGLKVLDKYDRNTWLGNSYRSTESVPGEWPVSYHGTSKQGAEGIIEGYFKPGPRQLYGRGIYSTPYMDEAIRFAKTFTSRKTGKKYKVILQNRVNPKYRLKYNNDKYWLIPIPVGLSKKEEQKMVKRAIRPYGLLVKEV